MTRLLLITALISSTYVQAQSNSTSASISSYVPKGYVISEKVEGDLNKDGIKDYAIIVKGNDKTKISANEYGEMEDSNRRGIIVLLRNGQQYDVPVKNLQCLPSDIPNDGVYYPSEVNIEIKSGKLYVHFAHGRYGYQDFAFRWQNGDFYLIGYDESNGGAVIESEVSVNFLTKKKITKVNTNENSEGGDEVFIETNSSVQIPQLIKLKDIIDFEELQF